MAGTVVVTSHEKGRRAVRKMVLTCTGDAANGSYPATVLPSFEGRIVEFRTNPGTPAPTDNWDVVLTDQNGLNRLQGLGADRDTSNSEVAITVYSGTSINPVVEHGDTLTLAITGNSVNGAAIVCELVYAPA